MNKKQWDSLSNKERANYILNQEIKVKVKNGIDANSRVGDCNVVTRFAAFAGVVQISNWHGKSKDALTEAAESLSGWESEL